MASENLQEYELWHPGDRIALIEDIDDGAYCEGEEAVIESIVRYTGTMNDRVAIYVTFEGTDEPTEVPAGSFEGI